MARPTSSCRRCRGSTRTSGRSRTGTKTFRRPPANGHGTEFPRVSLIGMSRALLDSHLQLLAASHGLPQLTLGDEDCCVVRIDGKFDLSIEFDEDSESLVLSA